MIGVTTSLRHKYVFMLFIFLFCFITTKGSSNFEFVSINKNKAEATHVTITGNEIIFNIDGIIVVSKENESFFNETNGNAELKANEKIVFKPGTKIVPKIGEGLSASIINKNTEAERNLKAITHLLSILLNKEENKKNSISKNNDKTNYYLSNSVSSGVLVHNQHRRVGNIVTANLGFLEKKLVTKYPIIQVISGFSPETVLVLRL